MGKSAVNKDGQPMKMTSVYLPEETFERFKSLAERSAMSQSAAWRHLVDSWEHLDGAISPHDWVVATTFPVGLSEAQRFGDALASDTAARVTLPPVLSEVDDVYCSSCRKGWGKRSERCERLHGGPEL